jgi:biopolymer transport protein ExbB/TolQ
MQELLRIVWSDNTGLGLAFVFLVFVASAAATFFAARHASRYAVAESGSLEQLKGALERWKKEQRGSQQELAQLDVLKQATRPGSLIRHRLLTIERMRATNVKVDFEALQQITFAVESSRVGLRATGFAVSFVLLLGLFGSVAGLALTLPELTRPESDTRAVVAAMTAAFSSGAAGLLGSIWVSLCNLGLTTAQARFFEKLERFTVEELLPQTVPDIRGEAWLRQMHYKIGEAFERIREIAEQNNQTVKEFGAVAEGFSRLVDNLEQSARKGASADVQRVLEQMGQVIAQVSRSNDSAVSLAASVPQALEAAHAHNQHVLARLDTLAKNADERHERLSRQLAAAGEGLPQALNALQQSSQAAARRVEEVLGRSGGVETSHATWPFSAQALRLILYSVPPMLLLILLVLLTR